MSITRATFLLTLWVSIGSSFLPLVGQLQAQTEWCGNYTQQPPKPHGEPAFPKTAITIPVVVHVLWHTEAERPNEAQVQSQITALTNDFRATNADLGAGNGNIPIPFRNLVADMDINFELASTDPSGQPHSGIIYKEVPTTDFGAGGRNVICYDVQGGSDAWCTDCYLNIWVCDLGIDGWAGFSTFPTQVGAEVPAEEDGVFIQIDRFGTTGTVSTPYDLGRTTTHEIGHYFNLLHPWGVGDLTGCTTQSCCNQPDYDDLITDTPPQIEDYLGACPSGIVGSCQPLDNYNNFMNFTDDACALMFTEGQKARVWDAIQNYRSGFLNDDCVADCIVNTINTTAPKQAELFTVTGQYGFYIESLQPRLNFTVYNVHGQILKQWRVGSKSFQYLDLTAYPAGVYFIHAHSSAGQRQTQRIVKTY